jgi:hypothetical protein
LSSGLIGERYCQLWMWLTETPIVALTLHGPPGNPKPTHARVYTEIRHMRMPRAQSGYCFWMRFVSVATVWETLLPLSHHPATCFGFRTMLAYVPRHIFARQSLLSNLDSLRDPMTSMFWVVRGSNLNRKHIN